MKALLLAAAGQLEYRDVPDPESGVRDVLVRVRACGICGSDVHGMDGSSGRRIPPLVMGHEAAGDVVQVGDAVRGWQVGDRVTFDSTISCGTCEPCRVGQRNLCTRRRVMGVSTTEYRQNGAFAELVAVPQHILYRLPDRVSYVEGALAEPVSVAAHAVARATIAGTTSAVVVGSGVIGLLIVQVLRARGCERVTAVDLDPARLALATDLGATAAIRSGESDTVAAISAATSPDGADVVFEAVGLPETVALAFAAARRGGTVVLVGNVTPTVELPLQDVVSRQLSVQGSAASAGEYPWSLDMIASGGIDVKRLVGAVRPLREGAAWFERLRRGEPGLVKVVLEP